MKKIIAERGITLVALIITIIVLLILAVVTISALRDGGIIRYAQNARDKYQGAQTDENKQLKNYVALLNDVNEEITGEPTSVEGLQNAYEFEYYSSLGRAINDINGVAENAPDKDKDAGVVGIYTDENNKPVIVLLQDTEETEALIVSVATTLNLGGHKLALTGDSYLEFNGDAVIDGRLSGSSVEHTANDTNSKGLRCSGSNSIIKGGTYTFNYSINTTSPIRNKMCWNI